MDFVFKLLSIVLLIYANKILLDIIQLGSPF
jgi:hypothetical protein